MSGGRDDRWRMPELERLGEQFRAAEVAEREVKNPGWWRRRRSWLPRGLAGLLAMLAGVAGVLELVAPAGASSPVNRAPVQAERSGSVRFVAVQEIEVDGRHVTTVRERGALDFLTGAFATKLAVGDGQGRIERRRVGTTLYLRQVGANARERPAKWAAVGLPPVSPASFSPPGGYTLIDPQVVFRVMAAASAPITDMGRSNVNGVETIHYRLSTSLDAFLTGEQRRQPLDAPSQTATLNVWLDHHGRPVMVRSTFRGSHRHLGAVMNMEVSFTGYGSPVSVSPPPPSAVAPTAITTTNGVLGDPTRNIERVLFSRY